MDITLNTIFLLFGGVLIGAVLTFLLLKFSKTNSDDLAKLQFEGERSSLQTKVESINEQFHEEKHRNKQLNTKIEELRIQLQESEKTGVELKTTLEKELENTEEKLKVITESQNIFRESFAALSKKALNENNDSFINQAEEIFKRFHNKAQDDLTQRQEKISEIVKPVKEQLTKVDGYVREVEKEREGAFTSLKKQIELMNSSQSQLQDTTTNLVNVLKNTKTRGQWGEIQLRRIVEIAGMNAHCDFNEQVHIESDGKGYLPDLVVKLPSDRVIIVDAKAPMDAYWQAFETEESNLRKEYFQKHAKTLRNHVSSLKTKNYQSKFNFAPEFVLLFLPNEAIYSAALEYDPSLIEDGAMDNVIIATPSTLIALLKAAAYGWRQEKIADEVKQFSDLGKELYERLATVTEHISRLGSSINGSVDNYNKMVGSIERRVIPSARNFRQLNVIGDSSKELSELKQVEKEPRSLDVLNDLKQELEDEDLKIIDALGE